MIHLVARRVRADHRDRVIKWLREVDGPRRAEALSALAEEGVDHETAMLLDTADGPILIYAMQTDDRDRSLSVADASDRPIDAEHRAVMRAADEGPATAQILLDLRADATYLRRPRRAPR